MGEPLSARLQRMTTGPAIRRCHAIPRSSRPGAAGDRRGWVASIARLAGCVADGRSGVRPAAAYSPPTAASRPSASPPPAGPSHDIFGRPDLANPASRLKGPAAPNSAAADDVTGQGWHVGAA